MNRVCCGGLSSKYYILLFIWLFGLLIRVPLYADKVSGAIFSLMIDTTVFLTFLPVSWVISRSSFPKFRFLLILGVIIVSAVLALLIVQISSAVVHFFPAFSNRYNSSSVLIYPYFVLLYALLGFACFWEKSWRMAVSAAAHAALTEQRASDAELKRLRSQLDPHFLFNALNIALIEVARHPRRAATLIGELSNYLRYSLDKASIAFVPLSAELAMVRSYLRIQSMRFGARLVSRIEVEPSARRRLVPVFLLQPLVENAIKHGIPDENLVQHVSIAISLDEDVLLIAARNHGDLRTIPDSRMSTGIGLANLTARLSIHYPGRHELAIEQEGEDVLVRIRLEGEPC